METQIRIIEKVVRENRLVSQRVAALTKEGFNVSELPMGSGGVLQQKKMADGQIRIQIGCGHGRYNYALAVTL